jgi:hypothetical protein
MKIGTSHRGAGGPGGRGGGGGPSQCHQMTHGEGGIILRIIGMAPNVKLFS